MTCKKHGDSEVGLKTTGRGVKIKYCRACERDRYRKIYAVPLPKLSEKELIGMTFNHLTLVGPTSEKLRRRVLWKASCSCGNTILRFAGMIRRGFIKSCGCRTKDLRVSAGRKSQRLDPRISSARSIWGRVYKDGCDFETFLELSQKLCTYCGNPPGRTFNKWDLDRRYPKRPEANFTYNGLDRIDNNKDHSPDNVVPCCTICNMMRGTLSVTDFLNHVDAIRSFQNKGA